MSRYDRFRGEIAAGGATTEPAEQQSPGWIGMLIIVGLLALLAWVNPWAFIFVFGLLLSIFLHELGHYSTAKWSGMKVTQFFLGFGPRLWSVQRGEVEYGLRALPLGAFVRIIGMNNLDDVDPADEARSYRQQSYPKRMLVITAGSLMHFAFAFLLLFGVFASSGRLEETGEVRITAAVDQSSPAFAAGLREGDVIVAFDTEAITSRDELVTAIQSREPGDGVTVTVDRAGELVVLEAGLGSSPYEELRGVAYLGVRTQSRDYVRQSMPVAVAHAGGDLVLGAHDSVTGVFKVLNPANLIDHLTGATEDPATRPTTVVGATQVGGLLGEEDGLKGVLLLLAGVNVFIGVFNLFPVLPLDGGHAAIATYEAIRSRGGRRYHADVSKMVPIAMAVVALLAFLLFTALYLDLTKPIG